MRALVACATSDSVKKISIQVKCNQSKRRSKNINCNWLGSWNRDIWIKHLLEVQFLQMKRELKILINKNRFTLAHAKNRAYSTKMNYQATRDFVNGTREHKYTRYGDSKLPPDHSLWTRSQQVRLISKKEKRG